MGYQRVGHDWVNFTFTFWVTQVEQVINGIWSISCWGGPTMWMGGSSLHRRRGDGEKRLLMSRSITSWPMTPALASYSFPIPPGGVNLPHQSSFRQEGISCGQAPAWSLLTNSACWMNHSYDRISNTGLETRLELIRMWGRKAEWFLLFWTCTCAWDPLEKGMATHSSILAWRIPWTEEPPGL